MTAGGLIFIAAATDDLIRAIDIKTGKTVWKDVLPAGGQATPMTYERMAGSTSSSWPAAITSWRRQPGDALIAYALPDKK